MALDDYTVKKGLFTESEYSTIKNMSIMEDQEFYHQRWGNYFFKVYLFVEPGVSIGKPLKCSWSG